MPEIYDLAGGAFEYDDHAAPNLSCRNCHDGISISVASLFVYCQQGKQKWVVGKAVSLASSRVRCPASSRPTFRLLEISGVSGTLTNVWTKREGRRQIGQNCRSMSVSSNFAS